MSKFLDLTINKYLDELGSEKAIPGGGSAAAVSGALGAACSLMVARFSVKRQKTEKDREELARLTAAFEKLIPELSKVVDEDPKVFSRVAECYSIQRAADTDQKKIEAEKLMNHALSDAFDAQARLAFLIVEALEMNQELTPLASGSVKNDLNVSDGLLRGAFQGAVSTCEINLKYLTDPARKKILSDNLTQILKDFQKVKHG